MRRDSVLQLLLIVRHDGSEKVADVVQSQVTRVSLLDLSDVSSFLLREDRLWIRIRTPFGWQVKPTVHIGNRGGVSAWKFGMP